MPDALSGPQRFHPRADPDALEDLPARLRATRWPDAPEDAGWSLGTDVGYLRELGWPDSFWRYSKVIALLTDPGAHGADPADPADAFDVVVPDLPGYGYCDRPVGPALNAELDRAC